MHPIEAFVRNPVKVWVGVVLVSLFGAVALLRMPMQLTPEVQIPTISIETRWPGASPQEVEREIVLEQEEQLKSVEGVTKMTSESLDSTGRITLEFTVGSNMDEALLRVNSRLQQVPEYPEDADEPVISTSSSNDSPIAWFVMGQALPTREQFQAFAAAHPKVKEKIAHILSTPNPGVSHYRLRELAKEYEPAKKLLPPEIDMGTLRRYCEDVIEAQFERVPGVSNANVIGGVDPELQVVVDPEQLAARQLTINQVRQALRAQNADVSGGDIWEGKRRWVVRTLSQFRSPDQVRRQILATSSGAPVYVGDVAEVKLAYKKPDGFVRRFGASSIAVNAIRETGANVLDVMDGLRKATAELNRTSLKDRGLELTQVYDETEYIYNSVGLVNSNIFTGSALTMITLMVFLHLGWRTLLFSPLVALSALAAVYVSPWFFLGTVALILVAGLWFARGALVISLAIPVSIIGTFIFLDGLGRSLNVISLAGMAFAVGMLVDNAVVVLENIFRHYQMGATPIVAAERATKEVWGAVLASTLTTLAVFIPVLYIRDEAGQLFSDIALAIAGAVGLSMLVSITLIPTVAGRLLRHGGELGDAGETTDESRGGRRPPGGLVGWIASLGAWFVQGTVALNVWIQASTVRRLAIAGGMMLVSIALSYLFWPKVEYLPNGNRNLVIGFLLPPAGYNLDELKSLGETVEARLKPYWDIDPDDPNIDKLNHPAIADLFFVARGRQVIIGLRAVDPTRARELIPAIMELTPHLPGSAAFANQTSLFARGLQSSRSIDVEITGPELEELVGYGGMILAQVPVALEPEQKKLPDGTLVPRATQARPVPSLDLSSPEVHVTPRLMQSSEMEIPADELGYTVNALIDGAYATDYYDNGKKIDLSIVGAPQETERTQDIDSLPVATPNGQLVPLSSIADVQLSSGPEQVNHRERQRAITIQVTPPPEMALGDAIEKINEKIIDPLRASGALKPQYTIMLSGTADKLRDTWLALRGNVILAMLITYLLMAALFESWIHPFIVITSVPLGAVGGIVGLNLLNVYLLLLGEVPQALDVLTMLGFVILIGTVVNNPILIVHQALNHMREDAMTPHESILESVRTRIRPIFMTTLTTVIGLAPLVLFPGAGSELYRGLGAVVLGGLAVSTVFTLIFIPAVFTLMIDLQEWLNRRFQRPERQELVGRVREVERIERPRVAAGAAGQA